MTSLPTYLIDEGLTSRESCRLLNGICSSLIDSGIDTLSVGGLDLSLAPAQAFFKSVDDAWFIPKTIGDTTKISNSAVVFKKELCMLTGYEEGAREDEGTLLSTASSFLTLIRDCFKLISDSSAGLRFLGTLGVSYLALRVRILGLVKNGFTVYCAAHGIAEATLKLFNDTYIEERPDRIKRIVISVLSISGFLCSLGLNGFGALQTLFGSDLAKAGQQVMTPFAFNSWKIGGSLCVLTRNAVSALV